MHRRKHPHYFGVGKNSLGHMVRDQERKFDVSLHQSYNFLFSENATKKREMQAIELGRWLANYY